MTATKNVTIDPRNPVPMPPNKPGGGLIRPQK
jgi:hypothetical protein